MTGLRNRAPTGVFVAAVVGLFAAACDRPPSGLNGSELSGSTVRKPVVFVTLAPQGYFVNRVAGNRVDVRVLVGQGSSEHQYDPTPQQMIALSEASAYFRLGVASETRVVAQLEKVAPKLRIVDTREGITLRSMTADEGQCNHDHDHGDHDHQHDSGAKDPHIWLDPLLVKTQAATIAESLKAIDPSGATAYDENLASFCEELTTLHAKVEKTLAPFRGREFLVYHPSYGYFADRYGLKQIAVETDGKEPTPRALEQLVQRARKSGTRTIFYQPQFAVAPAKSLANAIGGKAVPLDPLSSEFRTNLEAMADAIALAFSESAIKPADPSTRPGALP